MLRLSRSLFCLGGVFQRFRTAWFGGVVVQQTPPHYDAAYSLADAASLVKACADIIAKAFQCDAREQKVLSWTRKALFSYALKLGLAMASIIVRLPRSHETLQP
jgi:hypothetical protein